MVMLSFPTPLQFVILRLEVENKKNKIKWQHCNCGAWSAEKRRCQIIFSKGIFVPLQTYNYVTKASPGSLTVLPSWNCCFV